MVDDSFWYTRGKQDFICKRKHRDRHQKVCPGVFRKKNTVAVKDSPVRHVTPTPIKLRYTVSKEVPNESQHKTEGVC